MERLDLPAPVSQIPALIYYHVALLSMNWEARSIEINLRGNNGELLIFRYEGNVAAALMQVLNKTNLSVVSLHRRIINFLISDGKLIGTVTGAPD